MRTINNTGLRCIERVIKEYYKNEHQPSEFWEDNINFNLEQGHYDKVKRLEVKYLEALAIEEMIDIIKDEWRYRDVGK